MTKKKMKMVSPRVLLVLLCAIVGGCRATKADGPLPLVIWHGMGDSCCFPFSMGNIINLVKQHAPGIYVRSIEIGNSIEEDVFNGFLMNANDQVSMVCKNLSQDSMLKNGFNAMGFSQGGQFLRTLVQRCGSVKVHNLISVGGQHQGVFGFPRCPGTNSTLCEEVRRLLNLGAYLEIVQDHLVQAEYWQDPFNLAEYKQKCVFLPDINQENTMNADYKARLSALSNLVLVMFTKDTMVQPKESEWFGFYKEGQDKEVYTLFESRLWQQDLLGLQHLNSSGRLQFIPAPFNHLQFTPDWFVDNLMMYISATQSSVHAPVRMRMGGWKQGDRKPVFFADLEGRKRVSP